MKKNIKIIMFVSMVAVLENIIIFYLSGYYFEYSKYKNITESKVGLVEVCKIIPLGESLDYVIQKTGKFFPVVEIDTRGLFLNFGTTRSEGIGVSMVFDKNYNLTYKACNGEWEPSNP